MFPIETNNDNHKKLPHVHMCVPFVGCTVSINQLAATFLGCQEDNAEDVQMPRRVRFLRGQHVLDATGRHAHSWKSATEGVRKGAAVGVQWRHNAWHIRARLRERRFDSKAEASI